MRWFVKPWITESHFWMQRTSLGLPKVKKVLIILQGKYLIVLNFNLYMSHLYLPETKQYLGNLLEQDKITPIFRSSHIKFLIFIISKTPLNSHWNFPEIFQNPLPLSCPVPMSGLVRKQNLYKIECSVILILIQN